MKKPKTKLQAAKERFVVIFAPWPEGYPNRHRNFRRQLNNLIRLAREEALPELKKLKRERKICAGCVHSAPNCPDYPECMERTKEEGRKGK